MAKILSYDEEARLKLGSGISKLARAVRATLGPRGRNAVIEKHWGSPTVTKDGVTVSEEIELTDPYENMGAQLVKEAASKTSDSAGDGTTTATVLAEAIYKEGLKALAAGRDAMALKRGIDKAVAAIVEHVKSQSKQVSGKKDIAAVAAIAANNDKSIGEALADAFERVGTEGVITIEEGKSLEITVEMIDGLWFDRGYLSPYFVTDQTRMEAVLEDTYVLICEEKVRSPTKLIPLLEKLATANRPLLIIAEDVEGQALVTLVINKLRGILKVAAVKAPGYGDRRKAMLSDIAVLTGSKAIFNELGDDLEIIELTDLGRAKKIIIDSESTTIVEGAGTSEEIKGRVEMIRREIADTDSEYDKEKLQERLAKLAHGIAQINVGAATESEMKERKAVLEDALHATRAAVYEGVVAGGGTALIRAAAAVGDLKLSGDESYGADIVKRAVEQPARYIAENAGVDGTVVVNRIKTSNDAKFGFDAETGNWGDMFAAGIIDPTKVTRSALQNAASVAGLLLTAEAFIVPAPTKKEPAGHGDPYHAGGIEDMRGMGGGTVADVTLNKKLAERGGPGQSKHTPEGEQKPQRGKVFPIVPGKLPDSRERARIDVTEGDLVVFGTYSGTEIKVDGEEIKILRESDILAKVVEPESENLEVTTRSEARDKRSSLDPEEPKRELAESERPRIRMVNVWLEGADERLRIGEAYRVGVDAGAARPGAAGSDPMVEPEWLGRDALGLTILLSGPDIKADPPIRTATLHRRDGMKPVYFDVTLLRAGKPEFFVSLFLTRELFLLQKVRITLNDVAEAELVTP